jgi:hypothetical protein
MATDLNRKDVEYLTSLLIKLKQQPNSEEYDLDKLRNIIDVHYPEPLDYQKDVT